MAEGVCVIGFSIDIWVMTGKRMGFGAVEFSGDFLA